MTTLFAGALTATGITKQNQFLAGGSPITISHMAVGDGNGAPIALPVNPTTLAREVHRQTISRAYMNGGKAVIEMIIDRPIGPFWCRELAAIDNTGAVIAIANMPETFKPNPDTGASRRLVLSMAFTVANGNVIAEFIDDPTTVLASRSYVDNQVGLLNAQQSATALDLASLNTEVDSNKTASDAAFTALGNLLFRTGMELGYWGATAPAGWAMCSGKTIGNATSGATERANADTEPLFTMLWSSTSNTDMQIQTSAGVPTTRGASAAADFAASKRFPLPDHRGRVGAGADSMGGTAANRMTNSGTGNSGINGANVGAAGGADRHALTTAQMPSHTHNVYNNNAGSITNSGSTTYSTSSGNANTTVPTVSAGSGEAHPIVQPTIIRNVLIKL